MKILVAGGGGREHALAWRLSRCTNTRVFSIPGNPGIASVAECLPSPALTPESILAAAKAVSADLTVIGPEAPLVAGVVDLFRAEGLAAFGPSAEAARLEGSKVFAKHFFRDHGIPTAGFVTVENTDDALRALERFGFPVVVKADGLAAGKGVVVAQNRAEAESAIRDLGPTLVIEEFLEGPEISFIAICDGKNVVPLIPARDHKRIFDGDRGPNTGGMGAFCDPALLTPEQTAAVLDSIIRPTVAAIGFTGFLYAGLIMTASGPRILEYNVRLGDPEAQPLLCHLETDPAELLFAASQGSMGTPELRWKPGASACVVLAAAGYPGSPRTGDPITGIVEAQLSGAAVFHSGTRIGWSGPITAGGRVLAVTASGASRREAVDRVYAAAASVHFEGMQYRKDIGR